jgi:hypothetical protein
LERALAICEQGAGEQRGLQLRQVIAGQRLAAWSWERLVVR